MKAMKSFTCTTNYFTTYADILKAAKAEEERKKHAFPVNFGKSNHWKQIV